MTSERDRIYDGGTGAFRTMTGSRARAILAAAKERGLGGQSTVNPAFPRVRAYEIFKYGVASIRDAQNVHDAIAANIAREFGPDFLASDVFDEGTD